MDAAQQLEQHIASTFEDRRRKVRRVWRTLVALTVIAALALTYHVAAERMLDGAAVASGQCMDALELAGEGDPASCAPDFRVALFGLHPSHRARAEQIRRNHVFGTAHYELDVATAAAPDREARRRAVVRELELHADYPAALIATAGAAEDLRGRQAGASHVDHTQVLLPAAAVAADLDALRRLARIYQGRRDAVAPWDARRSPWTCLLGDRAIGIDVLEARLRANPYAPTMASALAGCDPSAEMLSTPSWREIDFHIGHRLAGRELEPMSITHATHGSPERRLRLLALLLEQRDLSAVEILYVVEPGGRNDYERPLRLPRTGCTSPAALAASGGAQSVADMPVLTQVLVAGATELERIAAASSSPIVDDEGLIPRPNAEALAEPAPALRHAAWMLLQQAAFDWLERGETARALETVHRADALAAPADRLCAAPVLTLAGQPEAALTVVDAVLATPGLPSAVVGTAHLQRAWGLALLGRYDDAHAATRRADEILRPLAGESYEAGAVAYEVIWLRAAMALRSGTDDRIPELPDADDPSINIHGIAALPAWLRAVQMPEAERRRFRMTVDGVVPGGPSLPAAMFIASRVVPKGADAEVWLDRVFPGIHTDNVPAYMWSRELAARFRGDDRAAAQWEERRRRLLSLIHDDRTAILATLALR